MWVLLLIWWCERTHLCSELDIDGLTPLDQRQGIYLQLGSLLLISAAVTGAAVKWETLSSFTNRPGLLTS